MMQAPRTEKRFDDRQHLAWAVACTLLLSGSWQARPAWGQDSARGELRIEGTHITKIILEGGDDSHREELSDPCGSVSLPVGTYRVQHIELQGGYACQAPGLVGLKSIAVMEGTPDVLKVGGPLRQEVKVRRQGRMLVLNYELLGIGGEKYSDTSRTKPPHFAVCKGDKAIASGQFEYG